MSKRQEIREKRRRERIRNQALVILFIVVGAFLITFALILPGVQNARNARATADAIAGSPVLVATPHVISAPVDGRHIGDPNALVKVDVFSDFRCSACAYYWQNIESSVIQNYVDTGAVYYSYYHFIVIDGHDGTDASYNSALASMCAADQGQFWAFHDTLFTNQVSETAALFSDDRLKQMAQNVGLDMDTFNQCYDDQVHKKAVNNDIAQGSALGVSGTPSIYVNGVFTPMNQLMDAIANAIAGQ